MNFITQDKASFEFGLNGPWSQGSITWRIPTAWKPRKIVNWPYGPIEFGEPYLQTFTINADGTVRVDKLGHWAERSPDGSRRRSPNTNAALIPEPTEEEE